MIFSHLILLLSLASDSVCICWSSVIRTDPSLLANLTITQDNLYLLIPSKLSWMANMLSEDKGVGIVDAMKALYSSEVYSKLGIMVSFVTIRNMAVR